MGWQTIRGRLLRRQGLFDGLGLALVACLWSSSVLLGAPLQSSLIDTRSGALRAGEAILEYDVKKDRTTLRIIRSEAAVELSVPIGSENLTDAVIEFRAGIEQPSAQYVADLPPFDPRLAHRLFKTLIAPARPYLESADLIMIVPSGPLVALPFGALVTTEPPAGGLSIDEYRHLSWFATKYAYTIVPNADALLANRVRRPGRHPQKPFLGLGNPIFEPIYHSSSRQFEIGGLKPIPLAAQQLRSVAAALDASDQHIFLGRQATEFRLRSLNLSDFRVIAFATHGVVNENADESGQAALVLGTNGTDGAATDGLLTADEILHLDLQTEWVLLLACSTGAALGVSENNRQDSLATAFLDAGSRSVLATHWQTYSEVVLDMVRAIFREIALDKAILRAEALRRALDVFIQDEQRAYRAHPMLWAPFVIIGEGGSMTQVKKP